MQVSDKHLGTFCGIMTFSYLYSTNGGFRVWVRRSLPLLAEMTQGVERQRVQEFLDAVETKWNPRQREVNEQEDKMVLKMDALAEAGGLDDLLGMLGVRL